MRRKIITILLVLSGIVVLDGFDLQCRFEHISWVVVSGSGCRVSNPNIVSREQSIVTSVNGQNLNSFSGSNYLIIDIDSQTVHFVPQKLGNYFPHVTGLQIHNSKLKEVQKADFAQFPKLRELHLNKNDLQSLPADLFDCNLDLEMIAFNNNKLKHVGLGILTPLKKLHRVIFNSNPCINIHASSVSEIPSVVNALNSGCRDDTIDQIHKNKKCLNFEGKLEQKDEKLEQQEEKLKEQKEKLKEQEKKLKEQEEKLKEQEEKSKIKTDCDEKSKQQDEIIDSLTRQLFISSSQFTEKFSKTSSHKVDMKCEFNAEEKTCKVFDFSVFDPSSEISKIFDKNKIEIDESSIEKLSIVDQQILFLPTNLAEKFPKLFEISVISTKLFRVQQETFTNLTSLNSLSFNNNKIREIPDETFTDNVNLVVLNFASNRIEFIAADAFKNLVRLQSLDLNDNLLTFIDSNLFENLEQLKTLKLNDNKFQFLKSPLFDGLPELSYLDISNNQIEHFAGDLLSLGNKVLEFRASNNTLKIIEPKLLKRLKNSELIDLTGNNCIDAVYNKNSTQGDSFEMLFGKVNLYCAEDDEK